MYLYDRGVGNTVIGNFNLLKNRDDVGRLWENFLVMERMKRQEYTQTIYSHYFWRLTTGAELDLVEEREGKLFGFEFKYSAKTSKVPKSWVVTYPNASAQTVNRNNWLQFVAD